MGHHYPRIKRTGMAYEALVVYILLRVLGSFAVFVLMALFIYYWFECR